LGKNPKKATAINKTPLFSKYNSTFTYAAQAPKKEIQKPNIQFLEDRIIGNQRYLKIRILPNRKVNRYDVFANENMVIHNFKANGATTLGQKGSLYKRNGKKILSYYVVENAPLEMSFSMNSKTVFDMELLESSFDLMTNPLFEMTKRENWMMPTPFVLNDAVVVKERIKPSPVVVPPVNSVVIQPILKDRLTVAKDSLQSK
jgi:hypothetical protein